MNNLLIFSSVTLSTKFGKLSDKYVCGFASSLSAAACNSSLVYMEQLNPRLTWKHRPQWGTVAGQGFFQTHLDCNNVQVYIRLTVIFKDTFWHTCHECLFCFMNNPKWWASFSKHCLLKNGTIYCASNLKKVKVKRQFTERNKCFKCKEINLRLFLLS